MVGCLRRTVDTHCKDPRFQMLAHEDESQCSSGSPGFSFS
jgi:hypothetical protein